MTTLRPITAKATTRYVDTLKNTCQALADTSGIGSSSEEYHDLHKFPAGDYLIFYRSAQNRIEFIRILNGSRNIEAISTQGFWLGIMLLPFICKEAAGN